MEFNQLQNRLINMIGYTIFNKLKVTYKNENIVYIGTSKYFKTSYI